MDTFSQAAFLTNHSLSSTPLPTVPLLFWCAFWLLIRSWANFLSRFARLQNCESWQKNWSQHMTSSQLSREGLDTEGHIVKKKKHSWVDQWASKHRSSTGHFFFTCHLWLVHTLLLVPRTSYPHSVFQAFLCPVTHSCMPLSCTFRSVLRTLEMQVWQTNLKSSKTDQIAEDLFVILAWFWRKKNCFDGGN